jgi:hypothetical protein
MAAKFDAFFVIRLNRGRMTKKREYLERLPGVAAAARPDPGLPCVAATRLYNGGKSPYVDRKVCARAADFALLASGKNGANRQVPPTDAGRAVEMPLRNNGNVLI